MTPHEIALAVAFAVAQEEFVHDSLEGRVIPASDVLDPRQRRYLRMIGSDDFDARAEAEDRLRAAPPEWSARALAWGRWRTDRAVREASRRLLDEYFRCPKCHGYGLVIPGWWADDGRLDFHDLHPCGPCWATGDIRQRDRPPWWPPW